MYAPIKAEITGPGGGPVQEVLTFVPDEIWMQKYAAAWEEVREKNVTP